MPRPKKRINSPRRIVAEPRSIQHQYVLRLQKISKVYQAVVAQWLDPLLTLWPREYVDHKTWIDGDTYSKWDFEEVPDLRLDAVMPAYNPLMPYPRPRKISTMTDSDIRRLWPNLDPVDVRHYAPWATTQAEVVRIASTSANPTTDELELYVRRAIEAEKSMRPRPPGRETYTPNPPGPGAFIAKPPTYPPVVIGPNGFPMLPPIPTEISSTTITMQLGSLELALAQVSQEEYIHQAMDQFGDRIERFSTREVEKVLNINIRREVPNIQGQIDQWRDINVSLIKDMTNSMYSDISRTIESAHMEGKRVEILAQELIERYGVNERRAALIARDQTLKLNGQINRSRQKQAGITKYRWITSRDERVRESHQELDGSVQNWDAPPSEGHPGQSYQCRCTSEPLIAGLDYEVE